MAKINGVFMEKDHELGMKILLKRHENPLIFNVSALMKALKSTKYP